MLGGERQDAGIILQQDQRLFFDLLRIVTPAEGIHHAPHRRMVDHAIGEHAAHDAVHHIIQPRLRKLPIQHVLFQGRTEVGVARLLHVQPGARGLKRAVRALPIGEYEALEVPVLLQHLVQQVVVLAGKVAVHAVVAAHHAGGLGAGNRNLEGEQIGLAQGAAVQHGIQRVASGLLVVQRVVFDVAHHLLRLHAPGELTDHDAGQDGVFAGVLEVASVTRFADQVHATSNGHVVALVTQLAADDLAVKVRRLWVPAGGHAEDGRQQGRVAALPRSHADANGGVRQVEVRQMQPRNAGNKAGTTVVARCDRISVPKHAPSAAMHQLDLLVQRHGMDDQVGAGIWIERRVEPRLDCLRLRSRSLARCPGGQPQEQNGTRHP